VVRTPDTYGGAQRISPVLARARQGTRSPKNISPEKKNWCALDRVHVGYTFSKALALYFVGKHVRSLTFSEFLLFPRLRGAGTAPRSAGNIEAKVLYIVILCSKYTRALMFENFSRTAAQSGAQGACI